MTLLEFIFASGYHFFGTCFLVFVIALSVAIAKRGVIE